MIKAKKSLGQNFLIDKNILEKIVSLTDIFDKDVLEVGPGTGNLTEHILKNNPKKLYVVEKDKILWEAPKKQQQVFFIKLLGANVNLGNIGTNDVIPLECLRQGLRSDTFFNFLNVILLITKLITQVYR